MAVYPFACGSCGQQFGIRAEQAGRRVRCPHCRAANGIPPDHFAPQAPLAAVHADYKTSQSEDEILAAAARDDFFEAADRAPIDRAIAAVADTVQSSAPRQSRDLNQTDGLPPHMAILVCGLIIRGVSALIVILVVIFGALEKVTVSEGLAAIPFVLLLWAAGEVCLVIRSFTVRLERLYDRLDRGDD